MTVPQIHRRSPCLTSPKVKAKKVVKLPVHITKAYRSRGTAPVILNLDTRWALSVGFRFRVASLISMEHEADLVQIRSG